MKCFRGGKSAHLTNNKICILRNGTCNIGQKRRHLGSECRPKKTNSIDEKKQEDI